MEFLDLLQTSFTESICQGLLSLIKIEMRVGSKTIRHRRSMCGSRFQWTCDLLCWFVPVFRSTFWAVTCAQVDLLDDDAPHAVCKAGFSGYDALHAVCKAGFAGDDAPRAV